MRARSVEIDMRLRSLRNQQHARDHAGRHSVLSEATYVSNHGNLHSVLEDNELPTTRSAS
jgi:hypothetical protein